MNVLEEFCEKVLSKTRDTVIDREIQIVDGCGVGVINSKLSELMNTLSATQKEAVKKLVVDAIDSTFHELLYNFDENMRFKVVFYEADGTVINLSEEHEENLVGGFLDSIDNYGKYNSSYDIVRADVPLKK